MSIICDKCLCNFSKNFNFSSSFNLLDYIKEDDSIFEMDKLDLDEIVRSYIILELPSRFVCSENCKGLCHTCGCNLNIDNCGC